MRNARHDEDPEAYDRLRDGWLNRRRVEHFRGVVERLEPGAVLELGCGTGRMLSQLASAAPHVRFIGVEPLEAYVDFGRKLVASAGLTNVDLRCGTGEQLHSVAGDVVVDLVLSSDVLHHVDSIADVVANVSAVSRPGGRWALVEPSLANPYIAAYQALAKGERNFRTRPFLRAAEAAGWHLVSRSHLFLIPAMIDEPPRWLVSTERRLERIPGLAGAVALELVAG